MPGYITPNISKDKYLSLSNRLTLVFQSALKYFLKGWPANSSAIIRPQAPTYAGNGQLSPWGNNYKINNATLSVVSPNRVFLCYQLINNVYLFNHELLVVCSEKGNLLTEWQAQTKVTLFTFYESHDKKLDQDNKNETQILTYEQVKINTTCV